MASSVALDPSALRTLAAPITLALTSATMCVLGGLNTQLRIASKQQGYTSDTFLYSYIKGNKLLWHIKGALLGSTSFILFVAYALDLYPTIEEFYGDGILLSGLILSVTGYCVALVAPVLKGFQIIMDIPDYVVLLSIFVYMAGQILFVVGFGGKQVKTHR